MNSALNTTQLNRNPGTNGKQQLGFGTNLTFTKGTLIRITDRATALSLLELQKIAKGDGKTEASLKIDNFVSGSGTLSYKGEKRIIDSSHLAPRCLNFLEQVKSVYKNMLFEVKTIDNQKKLESVYRNRLFEIKTIDSQKKLAAERAEKLAKWRKGIY